ncbi:diaminopimelate epimerase [Thermodesulfatator indicus DSM 15286]|uniref:Diaminopimelate epimerase n=1 Tax=Thermodesulfatator indicus (strain DSM 15286 / JCM 11887 / CIR29812) TaxID=667014 RepID=F8A802_THEID|nr:diaminopimelate epimerase [Thermodesulfatator indicus]AEH44995.1 diaminopimelate epimerase [Thermodesulfatator indicus DSM 15286]
MKKVMDLDSACLDGFPFVKMVASGNDFILINNFEKRIPAEWGPELARKLCRRAFSVGADGLILIEPPKSQKACFSWRFFNADGSEAEMCGNGGRCAARFAVAEGLCPPEHVFETLAGLIRAEVKEKKVKIELSPPHSLRIDFALDVDDQKFLASFINTGVPHAVLFFAPEDLARLDVKQLGSKIRFHPAFAPSGTNVNFVATLGEDNLKVRTYERGVEAETFACGTGACASAIIAAQKGLIKPPVTVETSGGEKLNIYFDPKDVSRVFLEGEARFVYQASLSKEALE